MSDTFITFSGAEGVLFHKKVSAQVLSMLVKECMDSGAGFDILCQTQLGENSWFVRRFNKPYYGSWQQGSDYVAQFTYPPQAAESTVCLRNFPPLHELGVYDLTGKPVYSHVCHVKYFTISGNGLWFNAIPVPPAMIPPVGQSYFRGRGSPYVPFDFVQVIP